MKTMRRYRTLYKCSTWILMAALTLTLCACGGSGPDGAMTDTADASGSAGRASAVPESESAADEQAAAQEADTADGAAALQKKIAEKLATADPEEAAHLLDVTFYASKEEAEAAAGERLIASHDSDAAGSGSYNPMSWCYALITAVRDETVVMVNRGYVGITRGEEGSGFVAADSECYEFLDAGDALVMQVNVEWYPVFQIDVSDADYKAAIPLGWDIYTSRDENGIPAPLTVTGLKIVYPITLYRENHYFSDEGATAHYPDYVYGSGVELLYADDDHPALAERLEKMNAAIDGEYEEGLGMLGLEAAEEYNSSGHEGSAYYFKDMRTGLCRADDTVLSFVQYYDSDLGSVKHSSALGVNLDTATGEDVRLDEVLTDVSALPDAVYERCTNFGLEREVSEAFRDVAGQYIEDGDHVSGSYLSWNICYEGLWLHFNDSVPQEILELASGRSAVFLPFGYDPDLFADRYTNVPAAYCYDIETDGTFPEYYALELNRDGEYIDFALREDLPENADPQGFTEELTVEIDHSTSVLREGISGMEMDAFVVHSESDMDYLYIQQVGGQGAAECSVYQLSYAGTDEGLYHARSEAGSVNDLYAYGDWDDHSNGINCRIMTDPTHFLMTRADHRLGYDIVYAYQGLARDGGPMRTDEYWTYAFDGTWGLYPLKDMALSAVNEDCEITGETTLYANTLIRPYRTDSFSWIDLVDQEGKLYRMETEKTVENPSAFVSVDGRSAGEIFGGISR